MSRVEPEQHRDPAPEAAADVLSADDVDQLIDGIHNAAADAGTAPFEEASSYWDASSMAPLSAASVAAVARLRAYRPPPFPLWDRLPVAKRAAVLVLLYADRRGDLRVVLTMRAAGLRTFSGHAAFPGGKADTPAETPYQIARREAWEEIGLPMDDARLPRPFRIEPLCALPHCLARTELVVRPVVALLHAHGDDLDERNEGPDTASSTSAARDAAEPAPLVEETMIPQLNAKEVAAVFSAAFRGFLSSTDRESRPGEPPPPPGHWYDGSWISWRDEPWRVHNFYVPVHDQHVTLPPAEAAAAAPPEEERRLADRLTGRVGAGTGTSTGAGGAGDGKVKDESSTRGRFKVWGMTAHILVDAATIAYGRKPDFEHNDHLGDEKIILLAEKEWGRTDTKATKM